MIKTNENTVGFGGTCGRDLKILGGNNGPRFGVVSVCQTTSWRKKDGPGFNERKVWMNLKLNDYQIQKLERNGGLFSGDEISVNGFLVQRNVGEEGHVITEIQVESIVSHIPKALRELAKEAGLNYSSQPQQAPQQAGGQGHYDRQPQQHAPQQHAPQRAPQQQQHYSAPQSPAPQHAPQYTDDQIPPQQGGDWDEEDFYGSRQQ
ncbi:hypothetical protein P3602_21075 [Vibrio parahaemolyticus]|uniref:hypothetical protein n=1 Tax=Vibrio TaxID=662 RepID=UPI001CDC65C6|nr:MULTISPECIES: hypothetical protein [Vibrio]MCA2421858.1 hypothetical protein [Vibrio alginolyticus]MCA2446534.1 hypothetical protein [Vibrio alginolyticus]MCR9821580.1 hypothetical protein [Vibrio parahaemolyticus]MDF5108337.1 hypothetical protein [Vibrio parahaemolyticus]MDF5143243.1 hypothetical protein [Vibrio parahaemolyticus]